MGKGDRRGGGGVQDGRAWDEGGEPGLGPGRAATAGCRQHHGAAESELGSSQRGGDARRPRTGIAEGGFFFFFFLSSIQ